MNMQNLMAQAQKMQRDIAKKKEEIDNSEFEGSSQWVNVKINGKKEVQKITITYQDDITSEDKEVLEDMLKIALNQACQKVDQEIANKMGAYGSQFGGLF